MTSTKPPIVGGFTSTTIGETVVIAEPRVIPAERTIHRHPSPEPRPEELRTVRTSCPTCGGGMHSFVWPGPADGKEYQKGPDYSRHCQPLIPYIVGMMPHRRCARCSLEAAVSRLCRLEAPARIRGPEAEELARLRDLLAERPAEPTGFEVHYTRAAVDTMAASLRDDRTGRPAPDHVARGELKRLLEMHREGKGRPTDPPQLAEVLDPATNARSVFPCRVLDGVESIRFWTNTARGPALTLAYAASDQVTPY